MIKASIKGNLEFPKFTFQEDLSHIADRIFITILQQNIENQVGIDGAPLPQVETSTQKRKDKLGQGNKTLIASRDLIEGFYSKTQGQSKVIISLLPNRKSIGGYLQISGIRTKLGEKFFKFFGINKQMENNAVAYMKKKIKDTIRDARS